MQQRVTMNYHTSVYLVNITQRTTFDARVRVLVEPEIITGLEASELPEEIRKIEEAVICATISDIENDAVWPFMVSRMTASRPKPLSWCRE